MTIEVFASRLAAILLKQGMPAELAVSPDAMLNWLKEAIDGGNEQSMAVARNALNQCRAECLTTAYMVLTKEFGFSAKRVRRAFEDRVLPDLQVLDDASIDAIFQED